MLIISRSLYVTINGDPKAVSASIKKLKDQSVKIEYPGGDVN